MWHEREERGSVRKKGRKTDPPRKIREERGGEKGGGGGRWEQEGAPTNIEFGVLKIVE